MKNSDKDDFNFRLLLLIGAISTLLLMEIVVVTQAYHQYSQEERIAIKQISQASTALAEILQQQQADLNSYRWVDRQNQRVSIPIDQAITKYVEIERQRATTRPQ